MVLVLITSCKKASLDSPSAISASILINGSNIADGTVSGPNRTDSITMKAQFSDPQGKNTIQRAVVTYSHASHAGMGMMDHMGQITLWDNGTHGDHTPGDGWFEMEDEMDDMMTRMGHNWNQIMGHYDFEFYCVDDDGNESNHISVHMDVQ